MIDVLLLRRPLAARVERARRQAGIGFGEVPRRAQAHSNPVARQCLDARLSYVATCTEAAPTELRADFSTTRHRRLNVVQPFTSTMMLGGRSASQQSPTMGGGRSAAVCSAAKLGKKFLLLPLVFA
jgi:hypothetical protein